MQQQDMVKKTCQSTNCSYDHQSSELFKSGVTMKETEALMLAYVKAGGRRCGVCTP